MVKRGAAAVDVADRLPRRHIGRGKGIGRALKYSTFRYIMIGESSRKAVHVTVEGIRGSSDRSVLVLTSLAGGPKHGYGLIKDIEAFAGVRLGPGTLYGCLAKLEQAGLVEAMPSEDRRHPYRITAAGLEAVRVRLTESARIAKFGLRRVAGALS